MAAKKLKLFMLISGQEVLAEVIHDVDPEYPNAFVVSHAMVIQLIPQGNDAYGIGLLPLSGINTEGKQRIYLHSVASESLDIPEDMVAAFTKRTTPKSKIEVVSSSLLIPQR
jgi:hypothetical protein